MIIRNGLIHDAIHAEPYVADLVLRGGKIVAIGAQQEAQTGEEVIDASGRMVYPGFVDAHTHLGVGNYGMGYEGDDYNEANDCVTPYLRGIDSFNPQDVAIPVALAGGVTTVGVGPGSANVLGGTFAAVKLYGDCVDDMVVKREVAMKCAFGENPKGCYRHSGITARMTIAGKLRQALFEARDYMERKEAAGDDVLRRPKFDIKMEALIPVLKGEMPLKAHAHRADDICTAIRIAKEFGVGLTIEHCTEGHLIAGQLARAGYPVAVGPTFNDAGKIETRNKTFRTPGILAAAGCRVSIISDAPFSPQDRLALSAGLAVKEGMDPFAALQAITINPAKHLGIEDRVGSIEVGKDADIVIADGDPMLSQTEILTVVLNGERVVG